MTYFGFNDKLDTNMAHHKLDTSGVNCPLPVLKTKKALNDLAIGDILQVTSTDSGSVKDMAAFCQQTGHRLLNSQAQDNKYIFEIQKA